nr:hypothetical protein [Tanacetum cinerariifolium]
MLPGRGRPHRLAQAAAGTRRAARGRLAAGLRHGRGHV